MQSWVVKIDSLGNKQWDKTILTTDAGYEGFATQTQDGCYLFGNYNLAGIGGDMRVAVSPNPFVSDIAISIQKENLQLATFTITNPMGKTIYMANETNLATGYTKMLDLSYLPNGLYFLEVFVDGERTVKQIVKQ